MARVILRKLHPFEAACAGGNLGDGGRVITVCVSGHRLRVDGDVRIPHKRRTSGLLTQYFEPFLRSLDELVRLLGRRRSVAAA